MSGDNNKMKGLLKGLRIISQMFENGDEQQEFEIGDPTDVKHVAHVGSEGPTDNNPSWMNKFRSTQRLSSSESLNTNKDIHSKITYDSGKCVNISSDSMKRDSRSGKDQDNTHELPLPKSSKQQSNSGGNMRESHAKEKSDKPRQPKRQSKNSIPNDSFDESKLTTSEQPMNPMDTNSIQLQGNTNDNLSPKSTNSKKSKDVQGASGSSKSRSRQLKESNSNEGTHSRSGSKSKESNSNEVSHSRHSSKSRELNSNDGSHSRTCSKSKDSSAKEGHRSSKSKESNSNKRDPSKSSSKVRNKHRLNEEGGQLKRGSNEEILRSYLN